MYENEIYSNADTGRYTTYQTDGTANHMYTSPAAGGANGGKKKMGVFKKILLSMTLGIVFGLFAGAGFYAVQLGTGMLVQTGSLNIDEKQEEMKEPAVQTNGNAKTEYIYYTSSDYSEVIEEVMPAMVSIVNNRRVTTSVWGRTYTETKPYAGSGIIVAENDEVFLIVSNNHVVEESESLQVTFIDGTVADASVKGLDPEMDLGVIAVSKKNLSEETMKAISVARLGDSDSLKIGTPVIAIGNALGYGQSATNGIISALNREMTNEDGSRSIYIQTNADINEGNSGGALLTVAGEVVGINSAKIAGTGVEGMGYAIPISTASPIIAELMERNTRTEKVEEEDRGYMGISPQNIDSTVMQLYGMPQGVYVYKVFEDTPAQKAGIRKGDILVKFDGQRISSYAELQKVMQYYQVGETVTVTIQRLVNGEYESFEMELTLGTAPEQNR